MMKPILRFVALSWLVYTCVSLTTSTALAGSATWKTDPESAEWNDPGNWTPATFPNGPADVATFFSTAVFDVTISSPIEVNQIDFFGGTLTLNLATAQSSLLVSGVGLTNHTAAAENMVTSDGGSVTFSNSAFAGIANLSNSAGGATSFTGSSTADKAILIANGGLISFADESLGGSAQIQLSGAGKLAINPHAAPGVTVGSIDGIGTIVLGSNNLTVGANNLSTTFLGTVVDFGLPGTAAGGSLTKIGTGTLTLSGNNTYSGGTIVNGGALFLRTLTVSGSQTGSGNVVVNTGMLGGVGNIAGGVTIGKGHGPAASISPGISGPGTLTIGGKLIFSATSSYQFALDSSTLLADKITANGVKIDSGARFSFSVITGSLPKGTIFTIIDNTSSFPILGTFSNLPDHSIFTNSGNVFEVNYEGGDGNDLTLTVQ